LVRLSRASSLGAWPDIRIQIWISEHIFHSLSAEPRLLPWRLRISRNHHVTLHLIEAVPFTELGLTQCCYCSQ
jgi:hypothetical protein